MANDCGRTGSSRAAADARYADQVHLSRDVLRFTGHHTARVVSV